MDETEPVTPGGIRLDPACLTWRFTRAGGPGGQHVNTSASRAELRCDLRTAGLPETNRRAALERLADRLDDAAEIPLERRATRPSRSQRQARLDDKKRHSARKADRRWRPGD